MTNNHKKLIVFDLNLDWKLDVKNDLKDEDIKNIFKLLKMAKDYQTVVLTTSGCFFDAVDFVTKNKLNKGYLIANGGAIIYDIENKKIISEHYLQTNDVKALFHHGYTMGLNVIFTTKTNKYIYVSNRVTYEKIKNKVYSPFSVIENYTELYDIFEKEQILDLSYTSTYKSGTELVDSLQLYNVERFYDNETMNFLAKVNKTSIYIHFGAIQSTKYKAIQAVMSDANIDSPNDVLYIAATCYNKECYIGFKHTLVSSNPNFSEELGNCKNHNFINDSINKIDDKLGLESNSFWK